MGTKNWAHQSSLYHLSMIGDLLYGYAISFGYRKFSRLWKQFKIDNVYTLHRLIIACAAFTNPKDLWNRHDIQLSSNTMAQAQENLTVILKTTPWSTSASVTNNNDHPKVILVPGSFSDHVIQILEKEIRPSFANKQAEKVVHRAQTTISTHQEKMKQAIRTIEPGNEDNSGAAIITEVKTKSLIQHEPRQPRFRIAPVGDTPNEEEEIWAALDNESEGQDLLSQPRRWNKNFLESIAVAEWCAQQPIQDTSRVHEVFMLLVGPILAMTDSLQKRYQIRGLDMLTRFLIQYHHPVDASDCCGSKLGGLCQVTVDSRIWIKIFERTGMDQLLDRNLRPLLAPAQSAGSAEETERERNDGLEALQAAFRAYLTLILVNTEPNDMPTSLTDDARPGSVGRMGLQGGVNVNSNSTPPISVETVFMNGVLGSFMRANNSKEYQMLVLEWMKRLVSPVISFDFILEQLSQNQSTTTRQCLDSKRDGSCSKTELGFQGVYGMGPLTIKYLPSLLQHIRNILQYPFPTSSAMGRLDTLNLAYKASEALYAIMEVSRPR
ncbi:hypothetical protein BGX28_001989 [Mortierella sp. GBA30]|nr:hypothetical protein BGX28_001989 [Mortierella sp. GBA30]